MAAILKQAKANHSKANQWASSIKADKSDGPKQATHHHATTKSMYYYHMSPTPLVMGKQSSIHTTKKGTENEERMS